MSKKKLFDFVIGNPPYNNDFDQSGDNKKFASPVYNTFMDEAFKVADKVELITPARFLFNAGSTPKVWNQKMLNDEHFKVLDYQADASKVFPNTDIKGGVAISYRDSNNSYDPILLFFAYKELKSIYMKVKSISDMSKNIANLIFTQNRFNLETLYQDFPMYKRILGSNGTDRRFRNNIFEKVNLFRDTANQNDDIKVLGLSSNKRIYRFISSRYVDMTHENINFWKVLVPRANGSGAIGEVLATPLIGEPLIGEPLIGYTQSFIGIGAYNDKVEAEATLKYVKCKFARILLGILKVTQDNDREVWRCIPLQDFTSSSDIDWSKSVHEIDLQLYKKYGLDEHEIDFIEKNVKEML